jgi:hypothetical protein
MPGRRVSPPTGNPTALRDEILRAGRNTRWFRIRLLIEMIVLGQVLLICVAEASARVRVSSRCGTCRYMLPGVGAYATDPLAMLGAGSAFGLLLGWPLSACYRATRRREIHHHLAPLPPVEQAKVLRPLCAGRGDAARIAGALLREVHLPGEVLPAAAPRGRGDEPAAAG